MDIHGMEIGTTAVVGIEFVQGQGATVGGTWVCIQALARC
jgi:hypothetical protein